VDKNGALTLEGGDPDRDEAEAEDELSDDVSLKCLIPIIRETDRVSARQLRYEGFRQLQYVCTYLQQ